MVAFGYTKLKAGDVRRKGDEVRHTQKNVKLHGDLRGPFTCGEWKLVNLIGHKILRSDLIAAEFRRTLI